MDFSLKERLIQVLQKVIDPETGMDVISMRLVKDLSVNEEGEVNLTFRPSSFTCPLGFWLGIEIKEAIKKIEGVKKVNVNVEDFVYLDRLMEILRQID
jgi:metal-sulfur cluster biosynthetic enzyme